MEYLFGQRIKQMGGSLAVTAVFQLPLLDHVHQFDAAQQDACAPEGLKPKHWPSATLDCPVILVDDVVQILVFADLDRCVALGIEGL